MKNVIISVTRVEEEYQINHNSCGSTTSFVRERSKEKEETWQTQHISEKQLTPDRWEHTDDEKIVGTSQKKQTSDRNCNHEGRRGIWACELRNSCGFGWIAITYFWEPAAFFSSSSLCC